MHQAFLDLQRGDVAPSVREVVAHTGLSIQSVHDGIINLVEQGHLVEDRMAKHRKYRAIGAFDDEALDRLSHADLVALAAKIQKRLRGGRLAA